MKPAAFRRMMSRLAHPQGAQRYEVEYGKPLVPDSNLPDKQTEPSPVTIQAAVPNQRDLRVKDPTKQSHTVAWGGGGGSVQEYNLTYAADNSADAGATVTVVPSGTPVSGGIVSFPAGTVVTLTAVPSGVFYVFNGWNGDCPDGHQTDNPLLLTMDSNKTILAIFAEA